MTVVQYLVATSLFLSPFELSFAWWGQDEHFSLTRTLRGVAAQKYALQFRFILRN